MPDDHEATRQVYWNISQIWVMYALLVPTAITFGYGIYRRARQWQRGQPAARLDRPGKRLKRLFKMAVLQSSIWRDPLAGALHAMLFWGFVTLFLATTVVLVHHDFGVPIMRGRFYLYFQSLFVDCLGLMALVGTAVAGVRRWYLRPKKLVFVSKPNKTVREAVPLVLSPASGRGLRRGKSVLRQRLVFTYEANLILILIFVILASGFLLEGWRIAATDDPWAAWSPVGLIVARISNSIASTEVLRAAHAIVWWGHLVLVFGLIAWAPYTKLLHVVTAPLNVYTSNLDAPLGPLRPIDFETAETFGVNRLDQFTWKDLLDLDSCTECGRCTSVCPANAVGKQLSPRDIILDLQERQTKAIRRKSADESSQGSSRTTSDALIGSTPSLAPEAIWQCTTCAACVEVCPVAIEQFPKIVDLRRFLMMEEADAPRGMIEATTSLEQRGHPFRGAQASRTDWAEGLHIPHIDDVEEPEVLLWVGCGGALVDRNQRTTRAVAQLLKYAGVKFGILGRDESCSGDPARRVGNEFLFDMLAKQNTETLASRHVHTIVTSCPHCFNTFRNEYPQFGATFEVYHHTTYLAKLIGENRLQLDPVEVGKITLHDPCYLGRHNGVTAEPRDLLRGATSEELVEMDQHGEQSFCCGGGGGLSFVDEPSDQRVNVERAKQALETNADVVAVACPFCATMLEDGVATVRGDRKVEVKDVAEIVLAVVKGDAPQKFGAADS